MARALHLVDTETGEVVEDGCQACKAKDEVIETAGHKISNLKGRITQLLQEAEEGHEAFPSFKRCHDYWRERCNHPRTKYDIEDFKLWLPLYEKHGLDLCLRAIDGAAFDPFISTRKNGSTKRHDDWELIHRKGGAKFREFCNKAPYHLPKPEDLLIVSKALIFLKPGMDPAEIQVEAKKRVRRWAS